MLSRALLLAGLLAGCAPLSAWQGRGPHHRHHLELLESNGEQYLQLDGERLATYDAIAVSTLRMGSRATPLAYAAMRQQRWLVVVDGAEGELYDGIGELTLGGPRQTVAYAAQRGSNWFVVHGTKRSRAWDAILASTLEVGDDGRVSYAAVDGDGCHVVVGEAMYGPYAYVGEVARAPGSGQLAFVEGEGRRCGLRVEGAIADGDLPHERCSGLRWSARGKHVAYVAESGGCAQLVMDGALRDGCGARPESIVFDRRGDHLAYLREQAGDVCIVFDEQEACGWQGADPPVFGSLGPGVIGRARGRSHVFVEGRPVAVERRASDLQLSRWGSHYAYLAERRGHPAVVHDGKAWPLDVALDSTLVLSDDGQHWAALTGDLESERLYLTVDGQRRERFDFRESSWLLAQHPGASAAAALLRPWVAAELARSLRQGRP